MGDNENRHSSDADEITRLLKLSARLAQQIEETLPLISESLKKSKFQKTTKALLSLVVRSGYLNSAILNACGTKNIYAASILFRPMIEHNFRHLYIFARALNENTDAVGEKYYGPLRGDEDRQALYNISKYEKRVYPENTQWNLTNEHNKSIRERAKDFRIDEIFYYLVENNNRDSEWISKFKKEYLLERLRQYTNFSSSVHGGPFGEATFLEAQKNPEATLSRFANESYELHRSLIETTYLFAYLLDENNKKYYEDIKKTSNEGSLI